MSEVVPGIVAHPRNEINLDLVHSVDRDQMDSAGIITLSEVKRGSVIHPAISLAVTAMRITLLLSQRTRETTKPAASDGDIPDWQ